MKGNTHTIAHVDLSTKTVTKQPLRKETYTRFLGGRGIAGFLLSEHTDSIDSQLPIILFVGPLVGSGAPLTDGLAILSRSPLTQTIGDTMIYGSFGSRLKHAGLDGMVIVGCAVGSVGIEISEASVRVVDAPSLWNRSPKEVCRQLPDFSSILSIGAAGENEVAFAGIAHNTDGTFGRSGLGAVWGAKQLKYIAIKNSDASPVMWEETAVADIKRLAAASPALMGKGGIHAFGRAGLFELLHHRRMMPTDNFRATYFEPAATLGAVALADRHPAQSAGCPSCFIQCQRRTDDGWVLPAFDALSHLTALICNPNLDVALNANQLCHGLGLDPISTASAIAHYQEVTGTHIQGDRILRFVEDIAYGQHEGMAYQKGLIVQDASQKVREAAMTVKGLPLSAFDPRGALGTALSLGVATIGGCYQRANLFSSEIIRKPVPSDRFSLSGKPRMVKIAEDHMAVVDALIACKNIFLAASLEEYAALLTHVLNQEWNGTSLLKVGARINYQERILNARLGFNATADDLPRRFFECNGSEGPGFTTPPIPRDAFIDARDRYYRIRGLDHMGCPTERTADRLELQWNN